MSNQQVKDRMLQRVKQMQSLLNQVKKLNTEKMSLVHEETEIVIRSLEQKLSDLRDDVNDIASFQ